MQIDYQIQILANAIISFSDSYAKNKQGKENEQPESEPTQSLIDIVSTLQSLIDQIQYNNGCKSVIQIPKFLQSLSALVTFRLGSCLNKEIDRQRLEVRSSSRNCLSRIQVNGDEQIQTVLVDQGYGRVMSISYCTAGGKGEEQDLEILNGLIRIYYFLLELYEGRNNY
ncbi:MAG: hypothetical protein EZS28_046378, partial [Streblomastix strix]